MPNDSAIVFIGHDATRTGAPISLLRIIRWFAENTHHTCIVILGTDGPLANAYRTCSSVHIWNSDDKPRRRLVERVLGFSRPGRPQRPLGLTKHQRSITAFVQKHRVECLFNNTGVTGYILAALNSEIRAPVVSRIPELEAYMRKNDQNGSARRVLELSDHFVAASQAVKDNLVRRHGAPPEKVSVIYSGCEVERVHRKAATLRAKLNISREAFLVGGCGTMDWRKGIDLFLQVAKETLLRAKNHDIYFCWVGGPVSSTSWVEHVYEVELLSLTARVFFTGEVADTAPYLADLDLFLLPSREDPFPLVMLEAARQGVPVVCFEGSGGATEFVDETLGVAVPLLDVHAMATAVLALHDDTEKRYQCSNGAYRKSLRYTPDRMGRELHELISDVRCKWEDARR